MSKRLFLRLRGVCAILGLFFGFQTSVGAELELDSEPNSLELSIYEIQPDPIGDLLGERKIIGLRSAVASALNNNPMLATATFGKTSAGYAREAVEWQRFPRLSVNFLPNFFSVNGVGNARSMLVEQPIWAGGRIEGQISVARGHELAAAYAESEARRKLVEQVALIYIILMRAEERVTIVDAGAELFNGLYGYVVRRNQAGAASSSDVEFARGRLAQIAAMKQQVRADLDRARSDFRAITVTDYDKSAKVELPEYRPESEAEVVASYLLISPLFAQRRIEVDSSVANLQVKRAGIFPTVSIRLEHLNTPLASGVAVEDTRMGLTLQYVPDAGLASFSLIKEAEAKIEQSKSELKKQEVELTVSARTSLSDFLTSSSQAAILEQQVITLQRSARSFLRQFESGKKTWIDVLNINRELVDAKINLSKVRSHKEQSQIKLMVNTGSFQDWLDKLGS